MRRVLDAGPDDVAGVVAEVALEAVTLMRTRRTTKTEVIVSVSIAAATHGVSQGSTGALLAAALRDQGSK